MRDIVRFISVTKPAKRRWRFKHRIRGSAFGWRGSRLAIQRLREAVSEIQAVARRDSVLAADGAVALAERVWPAFKHINTSSGALGKAVNKTMDRIVPFIATAPADPEIRNRWLDRLWNAVLEDGVSYLTPVEEAWGDLCGSAEIASGWADKILPLLRNAWLQPRPGNYVKGTDVCLASLLAAGRHEELLDVLSLKPHPIWPWRRYGIRALMAEERFDEALIYAEASRGLNIPNCAVDAECEEVLIVAGRREEAYRRYGRTANQANTGKATFRQIAGKYPEINPKQVLLDLAESSGNPGKWFAAAKESGYLDLALRFATDGRTDPLTLSRAARDFLKSHPVFSLRVGRLAVQRILAEQGFEITALDWSTAVDRFLAAADQLGVTADAHRDLAQMIDSHSDVPSFIQTPILRRSEKYSPKVKKPVNY